VLARAGFQAVAMDLPGSGDSRNRLDHESDPDFILELMNVLHFQRSVCHTSNELNKV
jgi:alpha-beta hydrolase superfamily lysophospholipase